MKVGLDGREEWCFIGVSSTTPCEDTRAKNMNFLRMNLVGQLTIPTASHHPKC